MMQGFTNQGINGVEAQGRGSADPVGGNVPSGYESSAIYLSIDHKVLRIEVPSPHEDTQP